MQVSYLKGILFTLNDMVIRLVKIGNSSKPRAWEARQRMEEEAVDYKSKEVANHPAEQCRS
jgi:hypothetical protein